MSRIKQQNLYFVLIGSECDRFQDREVSLEEGAAMAEIFGCAFFEVSARTAYNVNRVFSYVVRLLRQHNEVFEAQIPEAPSPVAKSVRQLFTHATRFLRSRSSVKDSARHKSKPITPSPLSQVHLVSSVSVNNSNGPKGVTIPYNINCTETVLLQPVASTLDSSPADTNLPDRSESANRQLQLISQDAAGILDHALALENDTSLSVRSHDLIKLIDGLDLVGQKFPQDFAFSS